MGIPSLQSVLAPSGSDVEKAGILHSKMCFLFQMLLYDSYLLASSLMTILSPLSMKRYAIYKTNRANTSLAAPEKAMVSTSLLVMTQKLLNMLSYLMLLLIWLLGIDV